MIAQIFSVSALIGFASIATSVYSETIDEKKIQIQMPKRTVVCSVIEKPPGTRTPLIVSVHSNETVAVAEGREFVKRRGGRFVAIEASGDRRLHYDPANSKVTFDPNRMFSMEGILVDLKATAIPKGNEAAEIERFGVKFLALCDLERSGLVIAVHNNTNEGGLTVASFKKNGPYGTSAAEVFINPAKDADDFYLVTTKPLFEFLKARGFNVVLQDNAKAPDDGSLSVYCGRKGIPYVNVEVEAGRTEMQRAMLDAVGTFLDGGADEEARPRPAPATSGGMKPDGSVTGVIRAEPVSEPAPAAPLRAQGLDYVTLLNLARKGDSFAVTRLCLLPSVSVLDPAAAAVCNADLATVLANLGDEAFAKSLSTLSAFQKAQLRASLDRGLLEKKLEPLSTRYPVTSAALAAP